MPTIRLILIAIFAGFLAALLLVSTKAHAQDSWSGSDKRMHAGVSALIGIGTRQVWRDEPLKAWGVALIPGLIKEATDQKPSAKDMVANALGAALGVYTGGLFVATNGDQIVVGYSTEF